MKPPPIQNFVKVLTHYSLKMIVLAECHPLCLTCDGTTINDCTVCITHSLVTDSSSAPPCDCIASAFYNGVSGDCEGNLILKPNNSESFIDCHPYCTACDTNNLKTDCDSCSGDAGIIGGSPGCVCDVGNGFYENLAGDDCNGK